MSSLASCLVPEAVKKLIPYQSARRIGGAGRIWLNANELETPVQYGSSVQAYNRYPDFLPHDIAAAYQSYCQIDSPTVAVRGADEAIDLLIRTFCQPGRDRVLICPPTYAMYEFCADALAIETIQVPLLDSFNLNVEAVIEQSHNANLVFLCSPNNPTGNVIPKEEIIRVLDATQQHAIVVVDEAYIEFEMKTSVVSLIEQYPNLVVIRTLSKAFGLAAVRCGFILADKSVMEYVAKLIPPYPMPDCVAEIVLQALSQEGLETIATSTNELIDVKTWFIKELEKFECIEKIYPSATNFVLLRVSESFDLFNLLLSNGIVTRNQGHEPALRNCIRITIGTKESMVEVLKVLQNQVSNQ
ncbi:histidinol-phosphate transaminase [Vibrionales bacterium C3R12]|uniref:histidinol-phosphate transaminase n=1 Tax=Vibrio cortegadensis TaxID=1328770 RepID=UPI000DE813B6|nr:histidinol-phosphate transaminase [Vibrio cortegadensis]MDN3696309.1 histidinol-phosphate transaminase [Vibrio cortegadensis]RBW64972.1 histidinol-phosphate transaminase [Vibrionales bacterium C3R12]